MAKRKYISNDLREELIIQKSVNGYKAISKDSEGHQSTAKHPRHLEIFTVAIPAKNKKLQNIRELHFRLYRPQSACCEVHDRLQSLGYNFEARGPEHLAVTEWIMNLIRTRRIWSWYVKTLEIQEDSIFYMNILSCEILHVTFILCDWESSSSL